MTVKIELDDISRWYDQNAPEIANDWFNGFLDALLSLENDPTSFAIARENFRFVVELREVLYGVAKRTTHRGFPFMEAESSCVPSGIFLNKI